MLFKGGATAVITPFNEKGIDFDNFDKQIDHQLKADIQAIVVCGTTGEATTMSKDERKAAIKFVADKVAKKIPVIAGTGTNDTRVSIEYSKDAQSMGADAILVTPPYYNKTSPKGLVAHFCAISDSVSIPMIMYNVPTRTAINVDPATMKQVALKSNAIAVKECNFAQMAEVIETAPKGFTVYSGDDSSNIPALALGAMGVISVASNVIPKDIVTMNKLFFENKLDQSREIFYRINNLLRLLFIETNPIPVKKAMEYLNLDSGILRLPLIPMQEDKALLLKEELEKLGVMQ